MFRKTAGPFRDFACFAAFLVLYQSLIASGFGQSPDPQTVLYRTANPMPAPPGLRTFASDPLVSGILTSARSVKSRTTLAGELAATGTLVPPMQAMPDFGGRLPASMPALLSQLNVRAAAFTPASGPSQPLGNAAGTAASAVGARPKIKRVRALAVPAITVSLGGPADSTDPYIVAQAQALNNDPTRIFTFVRDQIGFEVYAGSLRGARGTLWSKAGNSLDKSSLLVALLGAAGIGARYVQGTLPLASQQQLILSMFPQPYDVAGCPPPNAPRADPANDSTLLGSVANHYWVEFGQGNTPADPNFPTASIGQAIGSAVQRFTTIPASLQSKVTFRLDVETYEQAEALFGVGGALSTQEVMNQTFSSADLVGRPVTVGHFVNTSTVGFLISATTNTYSPYLRVSLNAATPSLDRVVRGTDYQEVVTNFPLGTQLVTGIFVYMDVTDSQGNQQTFQRTILDRIGFAARQGGGSTTVSTQAGSSPAIGPFDLYTVNALPALQDSSILAAYQTAYMSANSTATSLQTQLNQINKQNPSPADQEAIQDANLAATEMLVETGRYETAGFMMASDQATAQMSSAYYVKAYFNSPRLIGFLSHAPMDASGTQTTASLALDLRADDIFVAAPPMQVAKAPFLYKFRRGLDENGVETAEMMTLTQSAGSSTTVPVSTAEIFQAAQAQGILLKGISSDNPGDVDGLQISADAKARISYAVENGNAVLVPASSASINGAQAIGWFETNTTTGYTVGVLEDGGHQAITEYPFLFGFVLGGIAGLLFILSALTPFPQLPPVVGGAGAIGVLVAGIITYLLGTFALPFVAGALFYFAAFIIGALVAIIIILLLAALLAGIVQNLTQNPNQYSNFAAGLRGRYSAGGSALPPGIPDLAPPVVLNIGAPPTVQTALTIAPGASQVVLANGTLLPLTFGTNITNTETQTDNFVFTESATGFTAEPSLPSLVIPAGQTGRMEVCLVPTSQLPPPGTNVTIGVTAKTGSTNASASLPFTVPSVQSVSLSASPTSVSATPGQGVPVTLTIQSNGNVPANVALSSSATAGLTVAGLGGTVSVGPGTQTTQLLTLTPAASAPVGTELEATITASFGDPSSPQTTTLTIAVTVSAVQAQSAAQGAQSATTLGRTDIAATLSGLSSAIDSAISTCSTGTQAEVVAYVNNLIQEMNTPFLQGFVANLQAAVTAVQSATCTNIGAALTQLSNVLASLNTTLSSPVAYPFNLSLLPNSATAQPNSTSLFQIFLQNNSSSTNTYSLSLGALPQGVSGSLSENSVTIGPGQSVPVNGSPTNPTVSITPTTGTAFQFTVSASINGVAGSTQTATGQVAARSTFLAVQDVTPTPGFTNSGGSVDVTTHLANIVNQSRTVNVVLTIKDPGNNTVGTPVTRTATLSVQSLITAVDFGQISTTGFANGTYTLLVSVIDPTTNQALPGGTGTGSLLIGSPVNATLTASPTTVAPGSAQVTTTLTVGSGNGSTGLLTLLGSANVPGGGLNVALYGSTAYLCGASSIGIIDVSNPASPQTLSTFGQPQLTSGGIVCRVFGANLAEVVGTNGTNSIATWSLTNPANPQLGTNPAPLNTSFPFVGDLEFNGTTGYFSTDTFASIAGNQITSQHGEFFDYDFSTPSIPTFSGSVAPASNPPASGDLSPKFQIAFLNSTTALVASTTATGSNTQGTGKVVVVDITTPSSPQALSQVLIPNTAWANSIAVQGNLALVAGNTQGWNNPGVPDFNPRGNLTLTALDISNPLSPTVVSTLVTNIQTIGTQAVVLGGGKFAVVAGPPASNSTGPGQILIVDATTPSNLTYLSGATVTGLSATNGIGIAAASNLIYVPTSTGLNIYRYGGAPFGLVGTLATASDVESIALNGHIAYTCDNNEVTVADITNPAAPVKLGTAVAIALSNSVELHCSIQPDPQTSNPDLVMLADSNSSLTGNTPSFLAFNISNPTSPTLIASTPVEKRFFGVPYYQGHTAFFPTVVQFFYGSTIGGLGGDFVSLDVSNFSSPAVLGSLESPVNGSVYGGANNVLGATQANATTAYVGSSTATSSSINQGNGQVWVVDTTNPAQMSLVTTVTVPNTEQFFAPLVQGNIAVGIGTTGGYFNPCCPTYAIYQGNVVVAVFDTTNPRNPQIVSSITTPFLSADGFGNAIIGPNLFLFAGVRDGSNQLYLLEVNTANPASPVISAYPILAPINYMVPSGNYLYAAGAANQGLTVYSIPGTGGSLLNYNASVELPTGTNVNYNPASFSITPTTIAHSAGFDTVSWTAPPSSTISWNSSITGIQPGSVLPVALGGTVNFTVTAGSGTITLPQVNVNSGQILGINPATQTVTPGAPATYTLTVSNPTASPVTYNLAVTGVNPGWVTLPATVQVAASGQSTVTLVLQSALADTQSTYGFTVTATNGGTAGSVEGTLILSGTPSLGTPGSTNAYGVVATLTPSSSTVGQGDTVTYTVQLTNAGNVADTYALSVSGLPSGVTAAFDQPAQQVPPGLSNFRQTMLHLTVAPGTAARSYNFSVTATSQASGSVTAQALGSVTVAANGVTVALAPASQVQGGAFQMTVKNTGTVSDTFNLSLSGPGALVSRLASSSVTLGPGQSQNVAIAVGSTSGAALGSLTLVASATSRANTAVTGTASATINVPASQSVTAAFTPGRAGLTAPGPATFLLQVQNTGTTEDGYIANIISTSGPVQASLVDFNGASVQTTSQFRLPGTTEGQLVLNATLTSSGQASVTVKVTSVSNAAVSAQATAQLGIGSGGGPVAVAGRGRSVATGIYTSLDGSQSYDPNENRLSYQWSVVSKPGASQLTSLTSPSTPRPTFLTDADGSYVFQLVVNNGTQSSAPSQVTIVSYTGNVPPNANAGKAQNARRGLAVLLNGAASFDPDNGPQPLSYAWSFASVPAASQLSGVFSRQPAPTFTPDADGVYTILLTVSDGAATGTDTVLVTAADPNVPPNAVAGPDRRILTNVPVTLDGSGSFDPDNGPQPLSYQWHFVTASLSDTALQNATSTKATFTPQLTGFFVARLDVSDGAANSFDQVTVAASGYCDANADGIVNQADFDLMAVLFGPAQPNDPLDVNGDGVINAADVAQCASQPAAPQLPNLNVYPQSVQFTYQIGAPLPSPATFQVSSDGPVTFLVKNLLGSSWVTTSVSSQATPANMVIAVNPLNLAPGTYDALILVTSTQANAAPPVKVRLVVVSAPKFLPQPTSLTFTGVAGQKTAPQVLYVTASGQPVSFTVASSPSWLEVDPQTGNTPANLTVVAHSENLPAGTSSGTITLSAANAPTVTLPVTVTLTAPGAPAMTGASIRNAASGLPGAVAPGEAIVIGEGAGFSSGGLRLQTEADSSGRLRMDLGGTQVLFDGVPAPLLWVRADALSAIVPYEVAGHASTQVEVVRNGVHSAAVTVPVAASAPGIFTADASGVGQAAGVNVAVRGSAITLYVTGIGQTDPAGVDGLVADAAGGTPKPILPVHVTIGGREAQVVSAGGAPGVVAGITQVNVVIPADVDGGTAAVEVSIGGVPAQPGVTVEVK